MFLHVSVILFTGKGYPSMYCRRYPSMSCRWYPSMSCSRSSWEGGWYPSMPCRSPGPHPGGRLRGLAGGSPGPHPGGKLGGLAWEGGLQAHTQGGIPPCTEEDIPHTHTHGNCCGQYASYWNAFLFVDLFSFLFDLFAFSSTFACCEQALKVHQQAKAKVTLLTNYSIVPGCVLKPMFERQKIKEKIAFACAVI